MINFEASHTTLSALICNNIYCAFIIKFLNIIVFQQKHTQLLPVGFDSRNFIVTHRSIMHAAPETLLSKNTFI